MLGGRRWLAIPAILLVAALGAYFAASRMLGSDLVRSTLEQQLTAAFGQPVHIASASASILPRVTVNLNELTIGSPVAVQITQLRIATGLRPLFSRTVQDAEVSLVGGTVLLPLNFDLPAEGGSQPPAAASGSGLNVASVRLIDVRGLSFIAGKQTFVVDAESSIEGDRLEIRRLEARAQTTRIDARGALTSVAKLQGELTATADPLDLDELLSFASTAFAAPKQSKATAGAGTTHLRVALTAARGQFAANAFRDLSTEIDVVPGRFTLSPLAVSAFGGKFAGRLDADTSRAAPELRLNGRLDGLDVVEIMKAGGSPGGITGRLGGTVNVTGSGTDSDMLIRTARGSIGAALTDGAIPNLDMVRTIVLAFGKPSGAPPPGSGSSFSRIAGTFALANGAMSSNDIAMASRDFDMAGSGTLRIATGAVTARGDVILSRELTAQAGVDLRRYAQEDGRVVVPAVIGGTLQQPAVTLDLLAATRRALGNELQRRVKGLVDDLFKKKK